eukprot:4901821-Prymnesium_polylepis.1
MIWRGSWCSSATPTPGAHTRSECGSRSRSSGPNTSPVSSTMTTAAARRPATEGACPECSGPTAAPMTDRTWARFSSGSSVSALSRLTSFPTSRSRSPSRATRLTDSTA